MKLRFVYTPKPRQFTYKPQFFKPEEDGKKIFSTEGPGKMTHEAYRRYRRDTSKSKQKRNQSVLIYVAIILLLLYFIFF
ncbi:MAG TPA: hypothetical protein PKY63_00860 [Bacteroidales bacterium]|nr:hypothetical protein [Bacteroidales bacterium]